MLYLFYLISILGTLYFILVKRRFDLYTLAYFSALVYFLPGFFSYVKAPYSNKVFISDQTYLIMIIVLSSIVIGAKLFDKLKLNIKQEKKYIEGEKYFSIATFIISMTAALYPIFTINDLFSTSKSMKMEYLSYPFLIWSTSAGIGFVNAYINKQKKFIIAFLILLILNLLVGDRTAILIAMMGVITYKFYKIGGNPFYKKINLKWFSISIIFIYFAFMGKVIYGSFNRAGIEGVLKNSFKLENIERAFSNSEPFNTQLILETVISSNYQLNLSYSLDVLISLLPLPNFLLNVDSSLFNDKFQSYLFPNIEYGMAYNFWAEGIAINGLIGFLIFLFFYLIGLFIFNTLISFEGAFFKTIGLSMGTYWAFYIHRNSMSTIISFEKQILFVSLLICLIAFFISILPTRKRGYLYEN